MINCYEAELGVIIPYQSVRGFYIYEAPQKGLPERKAFSVDVFTDFGRYELEVQYESVAGAKVCIESTWGAWANPTEYGKLLMVKMQTEESK